MCYDFHIRISKMFYNLIYFQFEGLANNLKDTSRQTEKVW